MKTEFSDNSDPVPYSMHLSNSKCLFNQMQLNLTQYITQRQGMKRAKLGSLQSKPSASHCKLNLEQFIRRRGKQTIQPRFFSINSKRTNPEQNQSYRTLKKYNSYEFQRKIRQRLSFNLKIASNIERFPKILAKKQCQLAPRQDCLTKTQENNHYKKDYTLNFYRKNRQIIMKQTQKVEPQ